MRLFFSASCKFVIALVAIAWAPSWADDQSHSDSAAEVICEYELSRFVLPYNPVGGLEIALYQGWNVYRWLSTDTEPVTFANTIARLVQIEDAFRPFKNLVHIELYDTTVPRDFGGRVAVGETTLMRAIFQNRHIALRVADLYNRRGEFNLSADQEALLEQVHSEFMSARSSEPEGERISQLHITLAALSNMFSSNLLTASYQYLNAPNFQVMDLDDPRFQRMSKDDLLLWISRARHELAQLTGFQDYSESVIKDHFLKSPSAAAELIDRLAEYYRSWADIDSKDHPLYPNHQLSSYFELSRVIDGALLTVKELFGIQLRARPDAETWDNTVVVYEAIDSDGTYLGTLYLDTMVRPGKSRYEGVNAASVSSFPQNKAEVDDPRARPAVRNSLYLKSERYSYYDWHRRRTLLSIAEVRDFYHELGHAVHALLTNANYESLTGISSPAIDVTEMIAIVFEKAAFMPSHLRRWAKHWKAGTPIPESMISEIQMRLIPDARSLLEYLYLDKMDLELHSERVNTIQSPADLERLERRTHASVIGKVDSYTQPVTDLETSFGARYDYASSHYVHTIAKILASRVLSLITDEDGQFNRAQVLRFRQQVMESNGPELSSRFRDFIGDDMRLDDYLRAETEIRQKRRAWRKKEYWKFVLTLPISPLVDIGKFMFGLP